MEIKVVNNSKNQLPKYETERASGLDIRANSNCVIQPNTRILIPTGLRVEIPDGYEIQIRPRSGLALKHGITVLNSPGTIDADYRGEIGVILINHGEKEFEVLVGDKIAQLVFSKIEKIEWDPVLVISETVRSSSGFGSTGK